MKVAIAGAGNVGQFIANDLALAGHEVLIIEQDPGVVSRSAPALDKALKRRRTQRVFASRRPKSATIDSNPFSLPGSAGLARGFATGQAIRASG